MVCAAKVAQGIRISQQKDQQRASREGGLGARPGSSSVNPAHCERHPRTHITTRRLGDRLAGSPGREDAVLGIQSPVTRAHLALWALAGHTLGVLLVSPASYPTSSYTEVLGTQEIDSQEFILSQASGNRRKHPCKEVHRVQSEAFKPRGAHERRWCCGWTPTQVDRNQLLCHLSYCVTLGEKGSFRCDRVKAQS